MTIDNLKTVEAEQTIILTGDNQAATERFAQQLGLDNYHAEAIAVSKNTRKVVWEHSGPSFAVKSVFIALGLVRIATMWGAAFADVGLAAVLNSTRTLRQHQAIDTVQNIFIKQIVAEFHPHSTMSCCGMKKVRRATPDFVSS